jgi:hypothetical protein
VFPLNSEGCNFSSFALPYNSLASAAIWDKDFWSASNAKIWRPFMKTICDRRSPMIAYDAMNLLIKVKQLYGSNSDLSLTR